MKFLFIIVISYFIGLILSRSPAEWRSRVIYQILTDRFSHPNYENQPCTHLNKYCGGNFKGIMNGLDYIQGMGVNAIWISPVLENLPNGYHGYWTTDFYSINPHFGTPQELKELVEACHARDIWVMVDVVVNHVAPVGTEFEKIQPFNKEEHYHKYCKISDWENVEQLHNCWLWELPDLDHENPWVAKTLTEWAQDFVEKYQFDGLRIDAVGHVPYHFWREFVNAQRVFTMGEVLASNWHYIAGYQSVIDGILNYPLFYTIRDVFREGHGMWKFEKYFQEDSKMWSDQTLLGNFIGNHDQTRFLQHHNNIPKFKSALALTLGVVGIPIIYYGDEQGFSGSERFAGDFEESRESLWPHRNPENEIYQFIKTILEFRASSEYYKFDQVQRYADESFYAFTRGKYFFALTNSELPIDREIGYHEYKENTLLCNLFDKKDCMLVKQGKFNVNLLQGEVKILIPTEQDTQKNQGIATQKLEVRESLLVGLSNKDLDSLYHALPNEIRYVRSCLAPSNSHSYF